MSEKSKIDLKRAVFCYLSCHNRSCDSCPSQMCMNCSATRNAIYEAIWGELPRNKEDYNDLLPKAGVDVCALANGKKIMARLLYNDGEPMAWQNCANDDDLYMLNEVTDWAYPYWGEIEIAR